MRYRISFLAACVGLAACSESTGPDPTIMRPSTEITIQNANNGPFTADLIADGGEMYDGEYGLKVGEVQIWNDSDNLYVKFVITDPDWCITETHLHIASSPEEIPQANGNPKLGQFDYGEEGLACVSEWPVSEPFSVALSDVGDFGDEIVIAAHAVVWDETSGTSTVIVSGTDTDVIEVNGEAAGAKAVSANEPFNYPTCSAYKPDDNSKSVWDNGIGLSAFAAFAAPPAADWIWNTLDPEHPIEGDVVTFQAEFEVPGYPTGGTLAITADNGYRVTLNGVDVGSAQLGPGFPTTLKETLIAPPPQQGNWGVASQGWQSVESYVLGGLMSGENMLTIVAANEYMYDKNDGLYEGKDWYFGSYDPSGGSTNQDPFPGTGIAGDNKCYNPAGLIYKATVDYYEREETAWGAGNPFDGKNWATYITYTIQDCAATGLVNGGFEAPPVPDASPYWNIYDSGYPGLGWAVEWIDGIPEVYNNVTRPDPAHLELHRGVVGGLGPKFGLQKAELDTDWDGPSNSDGLNDEPASVKIYQNVNTCPGQVYTLSYWWSPRANAGGESKVQVNFGSFQVNHSGSQSGWQSASHDIQATGTVTLLQFIETGFPNSLGMYLDEVKVEIKNP